MSTNLSQEMGDPDAAAANAASNKIQKTHEGEHQGDYSDVSLKLTKHTFIFAMCAAINSCNLGFDVGVSSNASYLLQRDLGLSNVQRELFVGSINFWSIFGSLFSNWICDRYGRRHSFVVAAISFIIGLVIQSASNSYAVLMIGRVFVGLGVGFGLAIDPLYIAEISPAAHRGELVTWSEIAINVGILLGFSTGLMFYGLDDNIQWRLMFIMGTILPIVMIFLVKYVMPESPRYLVLKNQDEEAKEILKKVYPPDFNIDPVVANIKEALERESIAEKNVGWNIIFFPTPAIRRMLIVGIGSAISQQAVGIDAIQYYIIDVLENAGVESEKGRLGILMILGVLKLAFIVVGGKLFDRKGRRPLFFISLFGMCIALILISLEFLSSNSNSSTFTVIGLALYMSFFSVGTGPGAWLIPSEIFATSIRAKAMSLAAFANRCTATLMSSTFLSTANAIGWGSFFMMLALICLIVAAFLYVYLPETKGRSLEDMSVYFAEITGDQSLLDAEAKIIQEREAQRQAGGGASTSGAVEMTSAAEGEKDAGEMT